MQRPETYVSNDVFRAVDFGVLFTSMCCAWPGLGGVISHDHCHASVANSQ